MVSRDRNLSDLNPSATSLAIPTSTPIMSTDLHPQPPPMPPTQSSLHLPPLQIPPAQPSINPPPSSIPPIPPTQPSFNPPPPPIPPNPPTQTPFNPSPHPISPLFDTIVSITTPISLKLTHDNYLMWKAQVLPLIHGHNLTPFLSASSPNPTFYNSGGQVEFNPSYLSWNRQDQLLLGWLRSSLSESVQAHVVSCSSTSSLWSTLQQQYAFTSRAKLMELKRQLQNISKGSNTCSVFLQQVRRLSDELSFIGTPVSDDDLVLTVINGLGPEFNSFVAAITTSNRHDILTFSELQGFLLSHEALLNSQNASATSLPSAFYSNSHRGNQKGKQGQQVQRAPFIQPVSYNKGPILPPPQPNSTGPSNFQSKNSGAKENSSASSAQTSVCQICKKPNHSAKFCRFRYTPDPLYQQRMSSFQAYTAQPSTSTPTNEWILDSGASHHVTNDINNLSTFFNYTGSDNLQIGDGSGLSIDHIGIASITLSNITFQLRDTLHVPNFFRNLISLSKLIRDNPSLIVMFSFGCCCFKDPLTNKILLEVPSSHGLYHIQTSSPCPKLPQALFGVRTTASIWHDRFGHPSHSTTLKILKDFALPCSSFSLAHCHDCIVAKSHKLPFTSSISSTSSPLEIVYSDVWGPSPFVSNNGFRYYIIFVDDFSRFTWIFFMANKSEVSTIFTRFKAQVENLFSCSIKTLRTDGGTEYKPIANTFPQIVHQMTCPYTPEQNGVSERKHRHIVELSIAIMSRACIPNSFWDEIFSSVVYLINRLSNCNDNIPYSLLYNKQPDYSSLRILGCLCFPYTRPYNKNKLEPRALPCVFLGYATLQKGFRCLHLPTNKIYISRHVVFDETQFPFKNDPQCIPMSSPISDSGQSNFSLVLLRKMQSRVPSTNLPLDTHFSDVSNARVVQTTSADSTPTRVADSTPTRVADSTPTRVVASTSVRVAEPISGCVDYHLSAAPTADQNSNSAAQESDRIPPTAITQNQTMRSTSSTDKPPITSIHKMTTRSKDHTRKPKYYPDHVAYLSSIEKEPTTFNKANHLPVWREAMQTEINALALNKTWTLVTPPTDARVIGCKWVYKIKRRSDGSIERYKARLVAKGYHQQEGVDYFDTFSPVVRPTTIRVVLSLAVSHQWPIRQLDVNNAFLHGDLTERVYMDQPPGFIDNSKPNHVCLLSKSLYGLKQSPRAWFNKLRSTLLDFHFHESQYDPSLFISHANNHITIILVYVDDILITGSSISFISKFIDLLHTRFSLKDLGSIHFFLGIELSSFSNGLHLSQSKYILDILSRANMANAKPAPTPMATTPPLFQNDSSLFDDPSQYRSVVGALQYATLTRPDISYAVNRVSQFMHKPTINHWAATKRILRYLCGTLGFGLTFHSNSPPQINAYCDADWAGCPDDRRSTTGFAIYLGNNLVSWSAKKQPTVSRSSTEAEYRSLAVTCAEILWLQYLLREMHMPVHDSPVLWCDNIGATFLASNPIFHARTKHIEIDYHFVRERVANKELQVKFLSSQDQIADVLTKPLLSARFMNLRSKLQVSGAPSACGGSNSINNNNNS
ncbi:hypothetical protein LUZ62_060373 [Rhynchospora pubera]|uniref:Integrase catalytic domain-containing protein n=1 Tax=Rhynchospora pubera TaxID=906938 RepID=A0AAV8EAM3_9POAL|nr:hypothetical protein LUZ62_060373 [Rhynchospora pubera]